MATARQRTFDRLIRAGVGKVMANAYVRRRFSSKTPYRSSSRRPIKRRRTMMAPVSRTLRVAATRGVRSGRNRQSVTFTNREFFSNLTTPSDAATTFRVMVNALVNPANPQVFSWLASIADHFEEYKILKFKVIYEPSCTSSTTGQVVIGCDYDPQDPEPTDWSQVSSWKGAKHGSAWAPLTFYADKNIRRRSTYYTGVSSLDDTTATNTEDVRETSAARLYVCHEGVTNNGVAFAANTVIGKLYVEYKIKLFIPQSNIDLIARAGANGGYFRLVAGTNQNAFNAMYTAAGTGNQPLMLNNMPIRNGYLPFSFTAGGALNALIPWEGYIERVATGANAYRPDVINVPTAVAGTGVTVLQCNNAGQAGTLCQIDRYYVRMPAGGQITWSSSNYTTNPVVFASFECIIYFRPFPFSLAVAS